MSKRCDNCGAPWVRGPACRYCRQEQESLYARFEDTSLPCSGTMDAMIGRLQAKYGGVATTASGCVVTDFNPDEKLISWSYR